MNISDAEIREAAQKIKHGALVAFPTETVYGLGADATNDRAIAQIYAVKGRPQFNPLIVHVAVPDDAETLAHVTPAARALTQAFWPGPLTLVLARKEPCPISLLASAGLATLALRCPAHPVATALITASGVPIAAPSANVSGRLSPTSASHVREDLGERIAMVLDGGNSTHGLESTILDVSQQAPRLLRPGAIARGDLEAVLGTALASPAPSGVPLQPSSPGQLESHYAPRAKLRLNAQSAREGEAWLGFGSPAPSGETLSASGDLVEAAANLFRLLRGLDASGAATIAVAPIPEQGLGEAINDRLRRAAAPRP